MRVAIVCRRPLTKEIEPVGNCEAMSPVEYRLPSYRPVEETI